jgi:hypothetical protein
MTAERSSGTSAHWRGANGEPVGRAPEPPCDAEVLLVVRREDGGDLDAPSRGLGLRLDLAEIHAAGEPDAPAVPVLVLDGPATSGGVIKVRAVGVIHADRTVMGATSPCECLVAVALASHRLAGLDDLDQLAVAEIEALKRAWAIHNLARCAHFQVIATHGAGRAVGLLGARRSADRTDRPG